LDERAVDVVYICGLVTSVCVLATVMSALDLGFSVVVLAEGIRGLDEPSTVLAVQNMVEAGATFA
jgi:nicotinamidase-related amidase